MRLHRHLAPALCVITLAAPALAEVWSGQLLDRPTGIDIPAPFAPEPGFSDLADGTALEEFLIPGETVEAWTQLLTLTGLAGAAEGMTPDEAAAAMAQSLAQGYSAACPNGMNAVDLGSPAITGAEAVIAGWLACDQVNGNGQSEAMVVLIMVTGGTIYTAQWAEHVPATDGPPIFDQGLWMPRLDTLMTFSF
jgi:hypothetical protein